MPSDAKRAQRYLDVANVILLALDVEGRITLINRKGCSILGWQESELLGRNWMETCLPERTRTEIQPAWKNLINGDLSPIENPVLTKSGEERMIAWHNTLLRDEKGCVTGTLSSGEDITERRRAEAALQASERRYRHTLDAMLEACLIIGFDWHVLYVNDAAAQHARRPKEEILGRKYWDIWRGLVSTEAFALYQSCMEQRREFQTEFRYVFANGDQRWFHVHGQPIPEGIFVLGIDRTEQVRANESLSRLSRKLLQSQDAERRRLARELHDSTGQKLSALAMQLAALEQSAKRLEPQAQHSLAECKALTEDALREIRTLAHLLHPPELDELGLVDAIRHYVNGFVDRSGIPIELELSNVGRLPQDVETTLFRILQESLTNIHRHSGSPRASVHIFRGPSGVTMQVEDQGRGIPESVSKPDAKVPIRSGVGIAGMRERVRKLGGEWELRSTQKGTTLTAHIPVD